MTFYQKEIIQSHQTSDEEGFILVITMFILVVLSIIGLSATNLTELELKIAGNDRVHKKTFYEADGGTEIGLRLVYDNAICSVTSSGFSQNYGTGRRRIGDHIVVSDLDFALTTPSSPFTISNATRDLVYYPDDDLSTVAEATYTANILDYNVRPRTNLRFDGETKTTAGSGLQMVSGYEGLGASSVGGGTHKAYRIGSQHEGELGSQSLVTIGWQLSTHILNNASSLDCNY